MKNWLLISSIVFLIVLKVLPAKGQNLILNSSFETYSSCPTDFDQLQKSVGWFNPIVGSSPDFIAGCTFNPNVSVPSNFFGTQSAFEGTCYAHIGMDSIQSEYISCKLKERLKINTYYQLTFQISLAEGSAYAISRLGGLFTTQKPELFFVNRIDSIPQCQTPKNVVILDTTAWLEVKDTIFALGGEEYLTIGNFFTWDSIQVIPLPNSKFNWTSYYVDAVEVVEISIAPKLSVPNVFTPNDDLINDHLTISIAKAQTATTQIFNRWGSVVFESTDLNPVWDGTYNGNPVAEGVYFVVVNATGSGGAQTTETQTVHLLR